jgi:hypothetical protein
MQHYRHIINVFRGIKSPFCKPTVESNNIPLWEAITLHLEKSSSTIIYHVDEENLRFMMKEDIMKARWEKKVRKNTDVYIREASLKQELKVK